MSRPSPCGLESRSIRPATASSRNGARARSSEPSPTRGQAASRSSTPRGSSTNRPFTSVAWNERSQSSTSRPALVPGGASCSTAQRKLHGPSLALEARESSTTDESTASSSLYGSTGGAFAGGEGGSYEAGGVLAPPQAASASTQASERAVKHGSPAESWRCARCPARLPLASSPARRHGGVECAQCFGSCSAPCCSR